MDERRAREILGAVAEADPEGAILWHGPDLTGSDVDVLVLQDHEHAVARALLDAGLSPAPQGDGRVLWRAFDGSAVVADVMPARSWPAHYPSLAGVTRRSERGDAPLRVSSPADRLLIRAADAVAGRPLEHVLRKARPLLAEPGWRERLLAVAHGERSVALARLFDEPSPLAASGPGELLPARTALGLAVRSPAARSALRMRIAGALRRERREKPPPGGSERGLLIALSGMDGAGKSVTAIELAARLERAGHRPFIVWNRLAADTDLLDLIAAPARLLLGRRGRTGERIVGQGDARHRGTVEWAWVLIVALLAARACRRAGRPRRRGVAVICDRWLVDALVDLEVRYGRHGAAEWLLRRATPRADLAVLLEIDPATAASRKPGDQPRPVLDAMARRYASVAAELGFPPAAAGASGNRLRIDATAGRTVVVARVSEVLAQRESAS